MIAVFNVFALKFLGGRELYRSNLRIENLAGFPLPACAGTSFAEVLSSGRKQNKCTEKFNPDRYGLKFERMFYFKKRDDFEAKIKTRFR